MIVTNRQCVSYHSVQPLPARRFIPFLESSKNHSFGPFVIGIHIPVIHHAIVVARLSWGAEDLPNARVRTTTTHGCRFVYHWELHHGMPDAIPCGKRSGDWPPGLPQVSCRATKTPQVNRGWAGTFGGVLQMDKPLWRRGGMRSTDGIALAHRDRRHVRSWTRTSIARRHGGRRTEAKSRHP